ncbi:MAG: hypothetical protein IJ333_03560 [Clostridia bacterium]|nr:hypothetical protein [Clostridia bacterium]
MAVFSCECRGSCTGLAVVSSLIIGIITAFLQITGVITVTPAFLWVLLGIAVVYLAVALAAIPCRQCSGCYSEGCASLSALLIGILGTILFSIILLGVAFAATSVIGAIFVGALLFFFFLIVTSTACLVRARCNH